MNERLLERFEKEVLEKHGIIHVSKQHIYFKSSRNDLTKEEWERCFIYCTFLNKNVSKYEIAAIGLEAIIKNKQNTFKGIVRLIASIREDEDFCECIFRTIREIYKKEE